MPMKIGTEPFFDRVDKGLQDQFMRQAMVSAQDSLRERKLKATTGDRSLIDWELWRNAGEEIRRHTLENLDYYLQQLSETYSARGGHVYFAATAEEANQYIQEVVKKKGAKKVVKAKSMVTEEIGLNEALEAVGCDVLESDLAEYILQLDDHDRPSHIVVPSLHKNKEQIRDTFREKRGYTKTEKPEELAAFAREELREAFLNADVGITGCNFAVADSGSIALVTNEGNANMVTTLPETQITVMGMERIVPSWEELDVLVTLLCRSAVGQKLTTYVTGLTPDIEAGSVDSPRDYHLVIVDAGRSKALGTEFQSALHCIRCAACVNVCPVYRHIGGHSYGSIYQGPIGAVLSPILGGYEEYGELPYASSLCAACTEACPVKIPLHEHLIRHRQHYVAGAGKAKSGEKLSMKAFAIGASHPSLFQMAKKMAPTMLKPFTKDENISKGPGPMKPWTEIRDFPAPSRDDFRKWFEDHKRKEANLK
ncbi:L-lactate dehydrogenase complex protein LldF [Pullulanibacillus pueri]|uniref:Lactate utilization protein B n=1 Tax=Pullulanibacillus pueri TaxID=1437324 RepID=A0A8J3ELP3_9BACL|nr:LutB/LldF family L-lactate oxidation iron-sulfur protein [Pullulanibacillus pueri]MBM7682376.1 L-lactate dehydrogenase complex protein LldF [Pullulanibacillus pueri]GGH81881.1 lactate utilization protein B [Pullulanibacillus pueri]